MNLCPQGFFSLSPPLSQNLWPKASWGDNSRGETPKKRYSKPSFDSQCLNSLKKSHFLVVSWRWKEMRFLGNFQTLWTDREWPAKQAMHRPISKVKSRWKLPKNSISLFYVRCTFFYSKIKVYSTPSFWSKSWKIVVWKWEPFEKNDRQLVVNPLSCISNGMSLKNERWKASCTAWIKARILYLDEKWWLQRC